MVSANMVVTDHASHSDSERGHALATLRGILVSSLSRENLSPHDIDNMSSPDSPPVAPARRKRKVTFLENNTAGAAPVEPSQRQGSRPSSAKQGLHWFGLGADDILCNNESQLHSGSSNCLAGEGVSEVSDGTSPPRDQGKENILQRDERLRLVKEKQNEERQRKLEELKQQAMAAQKFREQKEEERRKRLEEMRVRDSDRRHQVEERKRQIWEAERDRREAILRKNQEREARIESKKKNERSSIVFAFGSSTPRMLEPADTGGSYWATRRATSTSNVMMLSMSAAPGPLTRRSSERELEGSKKRATSAGGIHRSKAEDAARLTASSIYDVFQWDSPPERSTLMSPVDVTPSIPPLADAGTTKVSGEEIDGDGSSIPIPITATVRAARRKTDLMPTLPSPRDLTPGRGQTSRPIRSPGRAYSMSRLDQLAQPRKPRIPAPPPPPREGSLSRSMTHLAQQPLRKKDTSRSMSQLSSPPAPPPRQTRAERLRRKAREAAARSPSAEQQMSPPGFRSGEVTPSRPQSSLSQHSVSSGAAMSSSVHSALKQRPQTAPRRQRPYSIAVTGISSTPSSPDTNKPSAAPDHRIAKSPSVSGTDKPPIPKVHAAKKPLTPKPDLPKKPVDKLTKSAKSSASPTPKATPLQSPGVEVPTSELISVEASINDETATTTTVSSVTTVNTVEGGDIVETTVHNEVTVVSQTADNASFTETTVTKIEESTTIVQPEPFKESKELTPPAAESVKEEDPAQQEPSAELAENEMTASMIAKTRITTEEEAKAALAERRRLAREQAEREAELERQRLEAERLAEEERLRQEEEEHRRMEEEQLRLLEEARKAEEERLRLAIEETQKREEEEKRRREEEAKLKQEKEEAERKAKEEAEKQRQEMEVRLKKEEEDRQARRKRVEAIMLRTRGKGTTPTNTPTKEDGDESPNEEAKQEPEKANIQEKFLNSERSHSDANLTAASVPKHNGHQNGVDNVSVDQNNVTNNLLDLSLESDSKIHQSIQPQPIGEQIIVAPTTTTPTNGKLSNEDNVNFNTPPPTSPFIAFQDNKKQDATVNDLLS